MTDFDAILTGLSTGRQKVWIAPVGTPVPEQIFDEDVMREAGWRNVGTLDSVLYVADQAELDRAISQRATLNAGRPWTEELIPATIEPVPPPLCECGHERGRHLQSKYACQGSCLAEPCECVEFVEWSEPVEDPPMLHKPSEANEIPDEEDFGLTQG